MPDAFVATNAWFLLKCIILNLCVTLTMHMLKVPRRSGVEEPRGLDAKVPSCEVQGLRYRSAIVLRISSLKRRMLNAFEQHNDWLMCIDHYVLTEMSHC